MYQMPQVMPGRTPLSLLFNQGGQAPAMPYAARPTLPMGGARPGGGILAMLMQRRPDLAARLQARPAFGGGMVPPAFGMGSFGANY